VLRHRGEELIAGFSWGCRGIAARELARALLVDATGNPAVGERYCRELTHALVARLPVTGFELDRDALLRWLEESAGRAPAPIAVPAEGCGRARRPAGRQPAAASSSSSRCTELTLS
jgi:hypothetical protein